MATVDDIQQRISEIDSQIAAIRSGGQSYRTSDGLFVQRPDLSTLYAERRTLESELASAKGGGGVVTTRLSFRRPA
ncbi:MAG: hypothetical protein IT435_16045 [Phycisphaerales bacterium]|nr:hypothetical protein [Phycisphaerales bacterium]